MAIGLISIAAAASLVAACGSSSSGSSSSGSGGSTKTPFVFGIDTALSGPLLPYSSSIINGVTAAVNAANKAGGIDGRQIKVVKVDSQEQSQQASTALTQLATSDKAIAVFGWVISNNCQTSAPVAAQYQIPIICEDSTEQALNPVKKYVFASFPTEPTSATAMVTAAKKLIPHTGDLKIGIVHSDNAGVDKWAADVAKVAKSQGGASVVSSQAVPVSAVDASPFAANVKSAGSQVIFTNMTPTQYSSYDKFMTTAGAKIPVLALNGYSLYTQVPTLKSAPYRVMLPYDSFPEAATQSAGAKQIFDDFATVGLTTADQINAPTQVLQYLAASAVINSLKSCGASCTRSQLATKMESGSLSVPGIVNDFGWTATSHQPAEAYNVLSYAGGKWSTVDSGLAQDK
jgi:branched-chain amino acid transport system substrate-binding protein